MNKILYVARKARGLSEAKLAQVLQVEETVYREMECSLADIPAQIALKLSKLFDVEPECFLASEGRGPGLIGSFMDGVTTILQDVSMEKMQPNNYATVINICNKALLLQVELNTALFKQRELEKDNEAVRELYLKIKEQVHKND